MAGKRTRTVDFDDPSAIAAAAVGKTGMELLRDIIAGKVQPAPIQATLGYSIVEVGDGFAKLQLVSGEHLYGLTTVVHSGVAGALLDAAMGAAVMTTLDATTSYAMSALNVHLTRPISSRARKILAEGWVVHRGSRLVTAEARLNDEQGRLLAHGSATCALAERPSA
jgi:uncharacterized protein (TIGR00369 family)